MRVAAVAAALLFAGTVWLGAVTPVRTPVPETVSLGPEQGESVAAYVADTRSRLDQPGAAGDRWALVSLAAGAVPDLGAIRVSRLLVHVTLPAVATAVSTVDAAGQGPVTGTVAAALGTAASEQQAAAGSPGRAGQVAAVVAGRLRAGCPCVAGLVVRGTPADLVALGDRSGVRAVDLAPAGTSWGSLAVRPLLPEQVTVVGPGPDDGPVPLS